MPEESGSQHRPELRVLVSEADIRQHVARLAEAVARDHPPGEPLCVVAVMKGALVFLADLVRHLPVPLEIELVNVRSYCGVRRRRRVEILDDVAVLPLRGRHVLLVDCVLDSGRTLAALRREMAAHATASLKTCVLLSKARRRKRALQPDYVGVEIPDVFVVGYGLDYRDRWRHLPYVAALPPTWASEQEPHDA